MPTGFGTALAEVPRMAYVIDRDLVNRATAGEKDAQGLLVSLVRPHVERQLLRYPVTEEDRRDLLQTTLMTVVRRLDSFRAESSFSTWLFRVTANEALMLMRSQRRQRRRVTDALDWDDVAAIPADDDAMLDGETVAANQERDERVRDALASLPEEYRDVVSLHYHMELGLQEIADKLELTESAVRSRLHRARTRLRMLLANTPVGREALAEAALSPRSETNIIVERAPESSRRPALRAA
jgi:RNA polymerase sigma-70 factor (ECF subfamily)